ncbi:MAG: phosphatase PAP2 family protein [bacterium]
MPIKSIHPLLRLSRSPLAWFVAGSAAFLSAMAALAPLDYSWTVSLGRGGRPGWVDFMRQSVFGGQWPGASDLPFTIVLASFVLYFASRRRAAPAWLVRWRPALGYLFVSSIAMGLAFVHPVKWMVGRARPWDVLGRRFLPFSPWYALGPHFVLEASGRGSFPSGHVATVVLPMALAYLLMFDPASPRRWRLAGVALAVFSLADGLAMTAANAISQAHWVSDGVGAIGFGWMLVHALYFWGLRVPQQRREGGPGGPRAFARERWLVGRWFEARLCLHGLALVLGVMGVVMGLRALALPGQTAVAFAAFPGAALAMYGWARLAGTHRALRQTFPVQRARRP